MPRTTSTQTLADAARCAHELTGVAWDEVEPGDLPAVAAELARIRTRVESALVAVAERLETTDAAAGAGWASAKDFLTHATGGRKGAGGALLRIAERTRDLPRVREALATGAISTAQAGVIGGRVATLPQVPEFREAVAARLLELAVTERHDASDLDRAFASVAREVDTDGRMLGAEQDRAKAERGAHHARFLSYSNDSLGGVRIKGYGTLEDAELMKSTLMPLATPQTTEPGACGGDPAHLGRRDDQGRRIGHGCPDPRCAHDGTDPRDSGARMWDALVEGCRRLQATDSLPHAHGASARITVTTSYEDLLDGVVAAGGGLLPTGDPLSAAAVRRLACDAEIIPAVLGSEGQVLDVGRAQRLVTAAIWLALVLRDRHCAFPGCGRLPIACDAHHITHWADGGPTSLDNLVLLCRRHHTLTHQSPWQVRLDPLTRVPVWTAPPRIDDRDRFTYLPPGRPPPMVA